MIQKITIGRIVELQYFASGISDAGEIAVGIKRKSGALTKGRDDSHGVAGRIPFEGGDETVDVYNLTQPAGGILVVIEFSSCHLDSVGELVIAPFAKPISLSVFNLIILIIDRNVGQAFLYLGFLFSRNIGTSQVNREKILHLNYFRRQLRDFGLAQVQRY